MRVVVLLVVSLLFFAVMTSYVSAQAPICEATGSGVCWYVDQNNPSCGDTASHGTWDTPFCTIASANTYHSGGDHVYILPGEYREIISPKDGIDINQHTVYSGYGSREDVKILGSEEVTGWNLYNGSVYVADFSGAEVTRCEAYPADNYPPYFNCFPDHEHIECQAFSTDCWEDREKWFLRADLESNFFNASKGFNDIDEPGEYYFDYPNQKLYIWPFESDNPDNHTIECSKRKLAARNIKYVTFQNLTIMHSYRDGIMWKGESVHIINNEIAFNSGEGSCLNNPAAIFHFSAQPVLKTDIKIIGNKIHDQGSDLGPQRGHGAAGMKFYSIQNTIIENNEVYNAATGIVIKGGYDPGYFNLTIRNNIIHDIVAEGLYYYKQKPSGVFGGIAEGNLIYNIGYGGIVLGVGNNLSVFGNTVWNVTPFGMVIGLLSTGNRADISNNIVSNMRDHHYGYGNYRSVYLLFSYNSSAASTSDYNLFFERTQAFGHTAEIAGDDHYPHSWSLAEWQGNTGFDDFSMEIDPQFLSTDPASPDFLRPAPGSPAIDNGTIIPGYHCPTPGDQAGCKVWYGSAPDIGAFEYISGPPCADANDDGTINIIDLALVIFWQGKNSGQGDWNSFKHLDVNNDTVIDFGDVSSVISQVGQSC